MRWCSTLFLVFACLSLNAQSGIKWGVEMGASASKIPWKTQDQNTNTSSISKENPVYSPLIGFTYQLTFRKGVEFNLGIQYQSSGYKNYQSNSGHFENHPLWGTHTYFSSTTEELRVHKLNFPFTVGVKLLPSSKIQPSVFIGYQPNLLLMGKYQVQLVTLRNGGQSNIYETNTNPVNQKLEPLKRIQHQWVGGVRLKISEQWKCTFSVATGNFSYQNNSIHWETNMGYIRNTNCNLFFSYILPRNPRLINRDF